MKKGKNMINQKNDLNMITRKLETELLTFHFDGLEISEITTTTSWMKLHINVLFIKDDVQITKVLYKDYETGLWYYIKNNGMIISHKDTFNHTIKNLIDEMIYDCHIEIEEATEDLDEYEDIIENEDLDVIIENENLDETEETTTRDTIDTLPPHIYTDTDINPVCMNCQDENLLPYNCNDCNNKKLRKKSFYGMFGGFPTITEMYNNKCFCCPADRQGNRCGGEQRCKETWKRYEAIINPEWHHVTLANLDFDMLDEKRQTYLSAYRDLKQTLSYLRKCKTQDTYDTCFIRYTRRKNMLWAEGKISDAMWKYIERKLSMQNVESGVWASRCEDATGHHESRRYNKSRA